MHVGARVVCTDDTFPTPLAKYYLNLPVKGKTYVIRAVYIARGVMHPSQQGGSDGEVGLLLQELSNPIDPRHKGHNELGFSSDRFRPLDTLPDEELSEAEGDLVGVSIGAPISWK